MKMPRMEDAGSFLHVSALRHHQVDLAFPLMQSALPRLTLEEWQRHAASYVGGVADPPALRGIMVAMAPNGVLRAAFTYTVEKRDGDGQAPLVRNLVVSQVAIPPLGRALAIDALAKTMQRLAREYGCVTVVVVLLPDAEWETDYFRIRGFEVAITGSPGR